MSATRHSSLFIILFYVVQRLVKNITVHINFDFMSLKEFGILHSDQDLKAEFLTLA